MPLVTETGAGLSNAESYCSIDYADTYHDNRGNSTWIKLSDDIKEQCLRKATDYMIGEYRDRWKGRRVLITQALDWPRVGVVIDDFGGSQGRNAFGSYGLFQVDYTIVPNEVKNACAELALKAVTVTLNEDISRQTIRETVGPISVEYDKAAPVYTKYRQIDMMLKVYLDGGGNGAMIKLSRS